jgi:O-antigen/teichoic acid export membrane protein
MRTSQIVAKNTSVLLLGRLFIIILGINYVAALSRYVQAEGMGIIATAMSLVSLASLLMNFGLGNLAIRDVAADKTRASAYMTSLALLRGALAFVFLVLIVLLSHWIGYSPMVFTVILIYGVAFIFDEFTDICFSIFNAHERMEYTAALQTGRDVINIGLSLAAIALKTSLFVIVGISAFANLIKLIVSFLLVARKITPPARRADLHLSGQLLVTAIPFAVLAVINTTTAQIDIFLLSLFRSTQEVGWYSSARLIITYFLLLPTILLQVIFPLFSRLQVSSREELRKLYAVSFKYLMVLGFALCAGTLVAAQPVILLVFGPGFEESVAILRILSFVLFWMFGYVNGSLLLATGGQNIATGFSSVSMILTIGMSLLLIPHYGAIGAGLSHILPGILFFIPITIICHRRLGHPLPILSSVMTLISAAFMAGMVVLALHFQVHVLVAVLVVAPCTYGVALLFTRVIGITDWELFKRLFRRNFHRKETAVDNLKV